MSKPEYSVLAHGEGAIDKKEQQKSVAPAYFKLTRLHKFPAGTTVVFLPCAWALAMAARTIAMPPKQLAIVTLGYFIGCTILHSGACIINDICDMPFDGKVERTKNRPLVTGEVSVRGAVAFLFAHVACLVGLLLLTNPLALMLGVLSFVTIHPLYPLTKRWTYWPQAFLGLAMSWTMVVAWATIMQIQLVLMAVMISAVICWTIVYDTIYACQDRKSDVHAGVKSTALLFGAHVRSILGAFAVAFVALMIVAGRMSNQGPAYYLVSVVGAALHVGWQITTLDPEDVANCWTRFKSNGFLGCIVWLGTLLDYCISLRA